MIKTPIVTPAIVTKAKLVNNPAPVLNSGNIAATVVAYAIKIIKNAFLILFFQFPADCDFERTSSVITIWSSTPVPTDAIIPAIAAKSKLYLNNAESPNIRYISDKTTSTIGIAIFNFLYLIKITKPTASAAKIPTRIALFRKDFPNVGEI